MFCFFFFFFISLLVWLANYVRTRSRMSIEQWACLFVLSLSAIC